MSLAIGMPSTSKTTAVTPTLSLADTDTDTFLLTVEPALGEVITTVGAVVSPAFSTEIEVFAEPTLPEGSAAVAVMVWLPFEVDPEFQLHEIEAPLAVQTVTPSTCRAIEDTLTL